MLKRIVASGDEDLLDLVWASTSSGRNLVWATPAYLSIWKGFNRAYGELAIIYDRLVYFEIRGSGVRRRFVLPVKGTTFTWRTRGLTLERGGERYRISMVPPRYTNLTEVAGSAESPGMSDVIAKLLPSVPQLEALGLASESLRMIKTYRIAKIHTRIWREVLAEAANGQRPPFTCLTERPEAAKSHTADIPEQKTAEQSSVRTTRREQVLTLVRAHPGLTVRNLADRLGTEPSNLDRPVNQLIDDKLLKRDGRALLPTGQG